MDKNNFLLSFDSEGHGHFKYREKEGGRFLEKYKQMYYGDELAKKIVDYVVEDAVRNSWEIILKDNIDKKVIGDAEANFLSLNGFKKIEGAVKNARLYGTGYIYIATNSNPQEPLNNGEEILQLIVFSPEQLLNNNTDYDKDITSSNFMLPEFYKLNNKDANLTIHNSKIVRIDNDFLSLYELKDNYFIGCSSLSGLYELMCEYRFIFDKVQNILKNFHTAIYKTDIQEIKTNEEQMEALRASLAMFGSSMKSYNITAIGLDDDIELKESTFPNIVPLLEKIEKRIVSNTNYPHTILLGDSPSGLGATGNEQHRNYLSFVKQIQENQIHPALMKIYSAIIGIDIDFDIVFNSIDEMTDKDKMDIADKSSVIVARDIKEGRYSPEVGNQLTKELYQIAGMDVQDINELEVSKKDIINDLSNLIMGAKAGIEAGIITPKEIEGPINNLIRELEK